MSNPKRYHNNRRSERRGVPEAEVMDWAVRTAAEL
jgi:hypothetical protein